MLCTNFKTAIFVILMWSMLTKITFYLNLLNKSIEPFTKTVFHENILFFLASWCNRYSCCGSMMQCFSDSVFNMRERKPCFCRALFSCGLLFECVAFVGARLYLCIHLLQIVHKVEGTARWSYWKALTIQLEWQNGTEISSKPIARFIHQVVC